MREHWEKLTDYWPDTGDALTETRETAARVESMEPQVIQIFVISSDGTCKLNGINTRAYLEYVLTYIAEYKISRVVADVDALLGHWPFAHPFELRLHQNRAFIYTCQCRRNNDGQVWKPEA
jgi:hypothetical protein